MGETVFVSESLGRRIDDLVELGRWNQQVVELSRRHCLNLEFRPFGGRGMLEAETGLPIDMRRLHCDYAKPSASAGSRLEQLAVAFYEQNCVGCGYRRPMRDLPNLASFIESRRAESAARDEIKRRELATTRAAWEQRAEQRRAWSTSVDSAMASVLADVALLDRDPQLDIDRAGQSAAADRLEAVASRAPELFTDAIIDYLVELVVEQGVSAVLRPLRQLLPHAPGHADTFLRLALDVLATGPMIEACRLFVDLARLVTPAVINDSVVKSLVALAGAPQLDRWYGGSSAPSNRDTSGLRVAAGITPDAVATVLGRMLAVASSTSSLVIPGRLQPAPTGASDLERCTAANAIRSLAPTHTMLAADLISALVASLTTDDLDQFGLHPVSEIQHTLAVLLVTDVGNVLAALNSAASKVNGDLGRRLFGTFERATRLLDPNDRWRDPGDPELDEASRQVACRILFESALQRLSGDWGSDVVFEAADLVKDLASDHPEWLVGDLNAILGAFHLIVELIDEAPSAPALTIIDGTPPMLAAMESHSRRTGLSSSAGRLLDAVDSLATVDVAAVLSALTDVLAAARADGDEVAIAWWLVPRLGSLGAEYGDEPGVLRKVLPVLYTYVLHTDAGLRAQAVRAWTAIAKRQQIPAMLQDLLPALMADRYVVVLKAVLDSAWHLTIDETQRVRLLALATECANDAMATDRRDLLKTALRAILNLLPPGPSRARGELYVLQKCAHLDGYDLRDMLRRRWEPATVQSPEMAGLRFAQARDPRIVDRYNDQEDRELTALLECGSGLGALPVGSLVEASLAEGPEYAVPAARFAEIAWRAGRPQDAMQIMTSLLNAIPDQPAYQRQRQVAEAIRRCVELEAVSAAGLDADAFDSVAAACSALTGIDSAEDQKYLSATASEIAMRAVARALLCGLAVSLDLAQSAGLNSQLAAIINGTTTTSAVDRTVQMTARAEALSRLGALLAATAQRRTATATGVRAFADLLPIASHLLLMDAAELNGDAAGVATHRNAARRRADAAHAESAFASDDPLGRPLAAALAEAKNVVGADVAEVLGRWAALPVPLLLVRGPSARQSQPQANEKAADLPTPPVAVVLTHIDDTLVTGPLVLRPNTVYALRVEVRLGGWPDWADRLDAEFVGPLSQAEAEVPTFTWRRPQRQNHLPSTLVDDGTLILRFGLSAGRPAPRFMIRLWFRGDRGGERLHAACNVAGHRELQLRPFDASRDSLAGQHVVDARLLELYERLHGAGYDEDQIQAFCRLLTAMCRAGMATTFNPQYRRGQHITERQFHDDIHHRLMQDPSLEGRVERGTRLALGFVDVRHDGITAELKVERKVAVTRQSATRYIGQPTQYAAADGARLSILCVLDMSGKTSPIGTAENYLWQLTPALHGLTNPEAPSIVTVLVINGSLPSPSTWSRKRIPVQP